MNFVIETVAPRDLAARRLTTVERVRSDLGLTASQFMDGEVETLIDDASASMAAFLNVRGDGERETTLGLETIRQVFRPSDGRSLALVAARTPLASLLSVDEDGALWSRDLAGADAAIGAGETRLTIGGGPAGVPFAAAFEGQAVSVTGAGPDGDDLETTIAVFVDADSVELAAPASTSVAAAEYSVKNPETPYEISRGSGLLCKLSSGRRVRWPSCRVIVEFQAGWRLPSDGDDRNLPRDIESACILFCRRKIEQLRENDPDYERLISESAPGIGSWTRALEQVSWNDYGVPSDVAAMLKRYVRRGF